MVRHHIKKAANNLSTYSKKTANLIGSKLFYALAILSWPVMALLKLFNIVPEDKYNENNPSDPHANLKALEKECRKNPNLLDKPGPATVSLSLKFRNALSHIDFRKFTNKWKDYLHTWADMAEFAGGHEEAQEILQVEKEIDEIIAADEAQKVESEEPEPKVAIMGAKEPGAAESEVAESQSEDSDEVDETNVRVRRRRSRSRRSNSRRAQHDGYSG